MAPEVRQRQQAAKKFNALINQQQDQLSVAKQRLTNLQQSLSKAEKSSAASEVAAKRLLAEAGQQLTGAETTLQALEKLPLQPNVTADNLVREGEVIKRRAEQRNELLQSALTKLNSAEAAHK